MGDAMSADGQERRKIASLAEARAGSDWQGRARRAIRRGLLRTRYEHASLSDAQVAAIRWLAAQTGGPAKVLVISEERCW
jgi:hypothetical protein